MSDDSKGYAVRPNADEIPCPFLLTAYNNGDLVPEEDGTLHQEMIDEALARVGLAERVRSRLVRVVIRGADDSPTTLNLFRLRDSKIDHTGSTGIRDPKVDPEKLPDLLAFGEDGRMYRRHFAKAVSHFGRQDPGIKGTVVQTAEVTALLEVFGRKDEDGERYLTEEDVRGLWLEGRYPEGWTPRPRDSIGVAGFLASWAKTGAQRLVERWKDLLRRSPRSE